MNLHKMHDPWARFAREQARLIVDHLEREHPDREFVCRHAMTLLQVSGCEEPPCTIESMAREFGLRVI